MTEKTTNQSNASDARLREFTRQERESGIHPAIQALHARPASRSDSNRRAEEFTRIERGHGV